MKKFQVILILAIILSLNFFYFLTPVYAEEYKSCCVCINIDTSGMGQDYYTVPKNGDAVITDATECETKNEFGLSCSIGKNEECGIIIKEMTKLEDEFQFKDIVLGITIPNLQFSPPPSEVDTEGNIYIPWLAEYIKAVYNFLVVALSIVAVVVIIVAGAQIIASAGGPAKAAGYKRVSQAVIGLLLAWGSYFIMYTINPNLTALKPLKIAFIEGEPMEEFIGTVDEGVDLSSMTSEALPPATGDTPYAKLKSLCVNSPLTKQSLSAVLPTWVDIGSKGGAVYVRGGHTNPKGCKATGAQVDWMINWFLGKSFSFPNPNNYNKESLKALSADEKKTLNQDKPYQTQLLEIYNTYLTNYIGRMCGDCGTWILQLYKCAGLKGVAIPQLKTTAQEPYFLAGGKDKSCRQAITEIDGGLQFGDVFWSTGGGHWFMYTGGAGLPYEIVEMGGGSSKTCNNYGPLPKIGDVSTCVRKAVKVSDYWIIKNPKKDTGCFIYRFIGK